MAFNHKGILENIYTFSKIETIFSIISIYKYLRTYGDTNTMISDHKRILIYLYIYVYIFRKEYIHSFI